MERIDSGICLCITSAFIVWLWTPRSQKILKLTKLILRAAEQFSEQILLGTLGGKANKQQRIPFLRCI